MDITQEFFKETPTWPVFKYSVLSIINMFYPVTGQGGGFKYKQDVSELV